MNKIVRALFAVFIAVLVAFFVGVTISVFYKAPEQPKPSDAVQSIEMKAPNELTEEQKQSQIDFNNQMEKYQEEFKVYARHVSIIALIVSVALMICSLTVLAKVQLLNSASLLGGLFLLVYSIIQGFISESTYGRFAVVAVALFAATTVGYIKLVKQDKNKEAIK